MAKFQKGQSGNPGGRPKALIAVKEAAQKHGPEAIKLLARLMKEADSDQAKIAAARELLDRGFGKATQPIAGDDDMPELRTVTRIELVPGGGSRGV